MKLTKSERLELQQQTTTRNERANSARRARLILLLADGHALHPSLQQAAKPVKWKYCDLSRRITPDSIVTVH